MKHESMNKLTMEYEKKHSIIFTPTLYMGGVGAATVRGLEIHQYSAISNSSAALQEGGTKQAPNCSQVTCSLDHMQRSTWKEC